MKTLQQLETKPENIPASTAWYLADLGESRGKQELFTKQAPQRLKVLREHALIESAVSSNRIEGVEVDQKRIGTIIFGKPLLRDRNEEAVRGYRDALKRIHEEGANFPVSVETILTLHRLAQGEVWDAGKYKEKESDIVEKFPNGHQRVRFRTVSVSDTPQYMQALVDLWHRCLKERSVPPVIALAASNLDFLCIHPFRDGNGRTSRLFLLLQCYHLGYEVGRYISLERLIEENKERYYETLQLSSQGWHEGRHDPWPYINYLLYILKTAYREFEKKAGDVKDPKGAKTELVESAIRSLTGKFTLSDLERSCPGVSRDMIRKILRDLKETGQVECLGKGPGAKWLNKGNIPKRG